MNSTDVRAGRTVSRVCLVLRFCSLAEPGERFVLRYYSKFGRTRFGVVASALLMLGLPLPAHGQSDSPAGAAATSTDVYGNAQFGLPERRPLGIFRFARSRGGGDGRSSSALNRTRSRRGGDTLFSIPGDLLGLTTMATLTNTVSPGVAFTVPTRKAESFYQYGGFGRRTRDAFQDPVSTAFSRRYTLLEATSQAAPIYRALARNTSMAGIRSAVVQTPFAPSSDEELDSPISLFKRLDERVASSYARTRNEAWGLFSDGAYRPAARAFEAALILSPEDLAIRIGEIFCKVTSGSTRTAMAIVADLGNHTDNVFSADVDMRAKFGDPRVADQLATDARLSLESVAEGRGPDLDATYVLVLWYLGKRDEAARFVLVLSRKTGAANYSRWPAQMREVERGGKKSKGVS